MFTQTSHSTFAPSSSSCYSIKLSNKQYRLYLSDDDFAVCVEKYVNMNLSVLTKKEKENKNDESVLKLEY